MQDQVERQLPSAMDAEEALVASLLVSPDEIFAVSDILKPEHFFREKNAWAYEAILKVWIDHQPIDQITVAYELSKSGKLEAVGGAAYLSGLISILGNSLDCEYYAQMIYKAWLGRQIIATGYQISALGYESDVKLSLEKAQELLRRLSSDNHKDGPVTLTEIMGEYLPKLNDYMDAPEATRGLPTGFRGIDSVTSGLTGLTILGGRPSQGKTELALTIARRIVTDEKKSVLIFSADASKWIVAERLLSIEASTTIQRVKAADGTNRTILEAQLKDAADYIISEFGDRIGVDDSPRLSRARIEGRLQRWESEHGKPSLLIFDYVELFAQKGEGEERISRVIEDFRDIGKLYDIPVLALSQLNREIEKRDVPRPQLSDLRYSGMLEQAGDIILFIWWPATYKDRRHWQSEPPANYVEIVIAKNKEGIANGLAGINFAPSSRKMSDWDFALPVIE